MVAIGDLYAFAGLLQAVASRSLVPRADPDNVVLVPGLKSDMKKGDVPAQWAEGYPKKWDFEDFYLQFNKPEPGDRFSGIVTENEKHLVMFNGSHATFVDLDTNTTVTTFGLEITDNIIVGGLSVRSNPQGGYDLFTDTPAVVFRRRVGSDFKLIGGVSSYPTGAIGDFDKNGRMATLDGIIYDLNNPDVDNVTFKNPPRITGMSFSGDAKYISTIGWEDKSADLWNATSGEKILQFPPTNAQNWVTKISPNNKHVAIGLGTGFIQIYSLANLTAEPKVLGPFNSWIRAMEWSPDSKWFATPDYGRVQLWKFPEGEHVQTWEVDGFPGLELRMPTGLCWLDNGNKISWMYRDGRYMYDFEQNLKWWWTLGLDDHSWGGGGVQFLKNRGYVATADGDSLMRFWKI
ncbi:hypothetical protein BDV95DRAFT_598479 [Massariosphaeria phaeospora]|uniref:Uncharacterized protein n=1 Tax=Massariosphaeria phaeospora TaxID=100035 RepID=A0A7C8M3C7_9PLEO|nr:hypothetical protein BDV95DRAFT_598479 [Massariosphaeria phaeospora]